MLELGGGFSAPFLNALFRIDYSVNDLVNAGSADAVGLRELTETVSLLAIVEESFTVQNKCRTADGSAFELGALHADSYSFNDQAAFESGDRSDDHYDCPAQRSTRVDVFSERDAFDAKSVQFVQHFEEVLNRPGDTI